MAFICKNCGNIIDRQILLTEHDDALTNWLRLGCSPWAFAWRKKELSFWVLAELMAQHTETPRSIAKATSSFSRGDTVDEIRTECFILPMRGVLRLQKDMRICCYLFIFTGEHTSTMSLNKQDVKHMAGVYQHLRRSP